MERKLGLCGDLGLSWLLAQEREAGEGVYRGSGKWRAWTAARVSEHPCKLSRLESRHPCFLSVATFVTF